MNTPIPAYSFPQKPQPLWTEADYQQVADQQKASSRQVGGDHYVKHGSVQPWDAMKEWMTEEQFSGFLRGCVIKYIARYRDKSGVEDLKKAQHYLSKLIEIEEDSCQQTH
jgi:hypothetical protein